MLSKKKKMIILGAMLMLLVVTGYLNVILNKEAINTSSTAVTSSNFFVTYREDREITRDQEILYYDAIIASASSSEDAIELAETKRSDLISSMEKELVMEGLIKAKGFEDAVVTSTSGAINVIVKSAQLSSAEVAQIVEVIQLQTNAELDNIKIIPVE